MDVLETQETQDAQQELLPLRERIGELDETLLGLLAERQRVARDIVRAADRGRSVLYTPWYWAWVMRIIRAIPERVFMRLKL